MNKENLYTHSHIHTHTMEYYSAIKKNEILPFAAMWMKLQNIILIEIRQILYGITYVEYKKIIQMDVHTKEK